MESRFSRIKNDRPFSSISTLIKEKTTLRYPDIKLILDLFVFFLKKKLIEEKELKIEGFGKLYVFKLSKSGNVVRFKSYGDLKYFINKQKKEYNLDSSKYNYSSCLKDIILNVSKCLKMDKADTLFIFRLFIYGIVQTIFEKRMLKIRNFGIFFVQDRAFSDYNICNKATEVKNSLRVKFKELARFLRELNGKEEIIVTFSRARRILYLNGFDDKIK